MCPGQVLETAMVRPVTGQPLLVLQKVVAPTKRHNQALATLEDAYALSTTLPISLECSTVGGYLSTCALPTAEQLVARSAAKIKAEAQLVADRRARDAARVLAQPALALAEQSGSIPDKVKTCVCEHFQKIKKCGHWSEMASRCDLHQFFFTDENLHTALRLESMEKGSCKWAQCLQKPVSELVAHDWLDERRDWLDIHVPPASLGLSSFNQTMVKLLNSRQPLTGFLRERITAEFQGRGILVDGKPFDLESGWPVYHSYELLAFAVPLAPAGMFLEFGVNNGQSLNVTSIMLNGADYNSLDNPTPRIAHGFDTFTGLPEDWIGADGATIMKAGTFTQNGELPTVRQQVELRQGLFESTLPAFLERHLGELLAFANIDCDLYNGATQVLDLLRDRLTPGTILHFHDILSDPVRSHFINPSDELKALHDFLIKSPSVRLQLLRFQSVLLEPAVFRVVRVNP